jgi:hypothetical protein
MLLLLLLLPLFMLLLLLTLLMQRLLLLMLLMLQVYGADLNKVDVMVGLLAEPQLPGFIFGEGIYSIFTLQV